MRYEPFCDVMQCQIPEDLIPCILSNTKKQKISKILGKEDSVTLPMTWGPDIETNHVVAQAVCCCPVTAEAPV